MANGSTARKAGIVGMIGAGLWMISVIIQFGLNLSQSYQDPLYVLHEVMVIVASLGIAIGYLGLIWGGAVKNVFGKVSVSLIIIGPVLIAIVALAGIVMQSIDSPIEILAPISDLLGVVGGLLTGIAVITAKRWTGWQRFVPLASFLIQFLVVELPLAVRNNGGPGMLGLLVQGVCWFAVALAVFTKTTADRAISLNPQASRQP